MNHLQLRRLRLLASLTLAAAISAIAKHPAAAQPSAANTPTLKLTTRLTRVDVTATDLNGHPIQGLKQSDFTVKEDGKPQAIKNFEESGTQQPAPEEPPPQLPPHVYTNAQRQPPTTNAVNVLLVDNVTTGSPPVQNPANPITSRDQAIKYVQTMPAGTQVVILELAERLHLIQNLTSDRDVLLAALHTIIPKQAPQTAVPLHEAVPIGEICRVENTQSTLVIAALEGASAFLSGIKGRKNLIWFTPGIPWLTDYGTYAGVFCLRDYTPQLQHDYNLLAAAQVALYPIDPAGIVVNGGRAPDPSSHISMEDLADATGGQAFYNTNDLATAIGTAIATGTHYYSLSYIPPVAKYDGQYHKINVTVNRPGVRLVYRKGYTSTDPAKTPPPPAQKAATQTPPDAALYTAMAHGAAPSTQIVFTVDITPSTTPTHPGDPVLGQLNPNLKLKGKPLTRYNFNFTLSPTQLTLTDAPNNQRQGAIEFTVAAYNGTGEILNVLRQTASFALDANRLPAFYQRTIPMLLQLDLPPGPLFLRAAVHDIPSNKLGTLEIPLTVPK